MENAPRPLDGPLPIAAAPAQTDSTDTPGESSGGMDRRLLLGLAGIAGAAALAKLAKAGPLEPPPGPISPTGATLSEINAKTSEAQLSLNAIDRKAARTPVGCAEPRIPITACPPGPDAQFVISQPGAYYLPSNLTQQPGMVCIDIQCSDVDIDGQGFAFMGSGNAASPPSICIRASGQSNIELYDCTFSGWTGSCCDLQDCTACCLSDINYRHCTCPPGYFLARGGSGFHFEDSIISVSNGNILCGDTSHFRSLLTHGSVCTPVCGDGCCIEDCTFSNSNGGTTSTGLPAPMLTCGSNCCVTGCDWRMCTCPAGYFGAQCVVEDCEFTGCAGDAITCASACCVDDCVFMSHAGRAVVCADGASVSACRYRYCSCPAGSIVTCGDRSCVEDCEISSSSSSSSAITCGESSSIEDCCVRDHAGSALTCAASSCVSECDFRRCTCPPGEYVVSAGTSCTFECCDISGGSSSSAIVCGDNSSVEDCSVIDHQGASITCGSSCSVCRCRCVAGYSGISCASDCDIDDNEVSVISGSGTVGGGPAISVLGARGRITCNYVKRGGIVIFGGSNGCVIEENTVVGGDGPPGTDGGSIVIAAGVTGCVVSSNTVRRISTTNAFVIPQGNSFGPVVNAISGGDLSSLSGGSHPLCNCVHL